MDSKRIPPSSAVVKLLTRVWFATLVAAAVLSWSVFQKVDHEMRSELLRQASLVAQAVDIKAMQLLRFEAADRSLPKFKDIVRQMWALRRTVVLSWTPASESVTVHSMKMRGDTFCFGPDSVPVDDRRAFPPGTIYKDPPKELKDAFVTHRAAVAGPFTDEYGTFVSAFVPVLDQSRSKVVMVIGVNVVARDWNLALLERITLPTGLALMTLIGLAVAVAVSRPVDGSPKPLLWSVLCPLSAMVVVLVAGTAAVFSKQHDRWLTWRVERRIAEVKSNVDRSLERQTLALASVARLIAADAQVKKALRERNGGLLLTEWRPKFTAWRQEGLISYLCFLDAARVCLLRVHKPDRRGDRIDRFTVSEAARTGRPASGIELGPLGMLTLQVVEPVFVNGAITGHVELGLEIEGLLREQPGRADETMAMVIRKKFVDRGSCGEDRREPGREIEWDRLPRTVVSWCSQGRLPDAVAEWVDRQSGDRAVDSTMRITAQGRIWKAAALPVPVATGQDVAFFLLVHGVADDDADWRRVLVTGTAGGGLVLALLMGFLYVLLRRTDSAINVQQETLQESEQHYRLLAECGSDVIWLYDLEADRFSYVSPSVTKLRGFTVAEVLQQSLMDTLTAQSLQAFEASIQRRLAAFIEGDRSARTHVHQLDQTRKDGSIVPTETVTTLITDTDGRVTHIQGVTRDITARKQAEDALEKRLRYQRVLADISLTMRSARTMPEGLDKVLRLLLDASGMDRSYLFRTHEDPGHGLCLSRTNECVKEGIGSQLHNPSMQALPYAVVSPTGYMLGQFLRREPFRGPVDRLPVTERAMMESRSIKDLLNLPIYAGDEFLGFLGFDDCTATGRLDDDDAALLQHAADLIGWHISAARHTEALRALNEELEQRVAARTAEALDLYNHAPCGYHSLGPDGTILQINDTELEWLGYTREEVEGRLRLVDLMTPQSAQSFNETYPQFVESGTTCRVERDLLSKGGSTISILLSSASVRDADGRFIRTRSTALDITGLKQANEELRNLSQAVEFSPSMIIITDQSGRVEYVNPAWEQVTGYSLAEMIGRQPDALRSGELPNEYYEHFWGEIRAGRIWRGHLSNRKKNGELYWESASIAPVHNEEGTITHFVAVKEDITAQRLAEEELRLAKEAADSANRAKSVFLANMSHELRTPMNAVLGFSQLLLRDQVLSAHQRQLLTSISHSGEHLLGIINDILEIARVESGRITLTPTAFELHLLLDDMERMFSMRSEAKGLRFSVQRQGDVPRCVVADETKLRQVIINLLGNAVKFTASGGVIILRVRSAEEPDGTLRLYVEVEDSGVGIAAEDIPHLFVAFFQTAAGRQVTDGTGLGLSISREFVRLMGGDLTVSSRPGEGSTFRFDIRMSLGIETDIRTEATTGPRALHLLPEAPPCRVLVADDQKENRDLLKHLLVSIGFEVRTAVDGVDAVTQCREWTPRLVLLDLRMPVMDGYETMRRIRAAHGASIKIIVISASVFPEDQRRAIDAGADGFVAKPFRENDLLEHIKKLTGLDYVYEDVEPPPGEAPGSPAAALSMAKAICQLPEELVARLRESTHQADYYRMIALVDEMTVRDEALGRQLRRMVEQFDYEALELTLSRYDKGK